MNNNKSVYLFVMCLLIPLISHAAVYKWVDENGTTHYSQKKPTKNSPKKFKITPPSRSVKTADELFEIKEQKRRLKINEENARKKTSKQPVRPRVPKSVSGGVDNGTDASRCALARDILNGSLKHSNGQSLDAYDIKTANNDIRKFCH